VVCNLNALNGLTVVVTDSATGAPLGAPETVVVARDGAYTDSLQFYSNVFYGVIERAGTYSVSAEREGYGVWVRNGVRIREDECHVIPVRVSVRLQAL
jgi:hypothetical protein